MDGKWIRIIYLNWVEFNRKAATQGAALRHKATTSEGLAQGPSMAVKVGFESETFRTEGTEHYQWTTMPLYDEYMKLQNQVLQIQKLKILMR